MGSYVQEYRGKLLRKRCPKKSLNSKSKFSCKVYSQRFSNRLCYCISRCIQCSSVITLTYCFSINFIHLTPPITGRNQWVRSACMGLVGNTLTARMDRSTSMSPRIYQSLNDWLFTSRCAT